MSDFISSGWSLFIAVTVVISVLACAWLAKSMASGTAPLDKDGNVSSTGHLWDEDLQELNNPLPRWWLYLFYITCVFAFIYLALYPGLGSFKGLLSWSSQGQYNQQITTANATHAPLFEQYLATDINELTDNPDVLAMGERLYLTYCTQCHGSDARGGQSFPNLTDDDWLGAGGGEYIKQTVLNGRAAAMPPMGAAIGGSDSDLSAVANYVLSLSDSEHNAEQLEVGKAKFAICSGCHGPDGKGNPAIGAPNLTDDVWLHGGSKASIVSAVQNGLNNKMPQFGNLLGEGKAHVISAYVLSLSNTSEPNSE